MKKKNFMKGMIILLLSLNPSFLISCGNSNNSKEPLGSIDSKETAVLTTVTFTNSRIEGVNFTLGKDGQISSSDKTLSGEYEKRGADNFLRVVLHFLEGDGAEYLLIVDNDVYFISAGSSTVITDYIYDPYTKMVTYTKMDGRYINPEDFMYILKENDGIETLTHPLKNFKKVGSLSKTKLKE